MSSDPSEVARALLEAPNARIMTCFDVIAAAEQLLGVTLRPPSRSWRLRAMVGFQRIVAARARRH